MGKPRGCGGIWEGGIVAWQDSDHRLSFRSSETQLYGFISNAIREALEADDDNKPPELKADIRMISGCEDKQTSADGKTMILFWTSANVIAPSLLTPIVCLSL